MTKVDDIQNIPGTNYQIGIVGDTIMLKPNGKDWSERKSKTVRLYAPTYQEFKGTEFEDQHVYTVKLEDLKKIHADLKNGTFTSLDNYKQQTKPKKPRGKK